MSGDLDEARDLLARWAAGRVTDPDVWARSGPRLLAGLVAEVEVQREWRTWLRSQCEAAIGEEERLRGRLLAAEGVIEAARTWRSGVWGADEDLVRALDVYDVDRAVESVVTADQETPE